MKIHFTILLLFFFLIESISAQDLFIIPTSSNISFDFSPSFVNTHTMINYDNISVIRPMRNKSEFINGTGLNIGFLHNNTLIFHYLTNFNSNRKKLTEFSIGTTGCLLISRQLFLFYALLIKYDNNTFNPIDYIENYDSRNQFTKLDTIVENKHVQLDLKGMLRIYNKLNVGFSISNIEIKNIIRTPTIPLAYNFLLNYSVYKPRDFEFRLYFKWHYQEKYFFHDNLNLMNTKNYLSTYVAFIHECLIANIGILKNRKTITPFLSIGYSYKGFNLSVGAMRSNFLTNHIYTYQITIQEINLQ
ncbi:MAG: hypothetical protein HY738_00675, partial [Bacteroidia bacterium]|nr:hypothetical protein [Bacteroidia bacterium]